MDALTGKSNSVRLKIESSIVKTLEPIAAQLKNEFGGIFVKDEDLVSLLLKLRCKSFSKRELDFIRKEILSDEQRAEWVLARVKEASRQGTTADFKALLKQIRKS